MEVESYSNDNSAFKDSYGAEENEQELAKRQKKTRDSLLLWIINTELEKHGQGLIKKSASSSSPPKQKKTKEDKISV